MGQGPKVVPSIKNHTASQSACQTARLPACSDRSGALAKGATRKGELTSYAIAWLLCICPCVCMCVCVCACVCVAPIRFVLNCIFAVFSIAILEYLSILFLFHFSPFRFVSFHFVFISFLFDSATWNLCYASHK